MRILLVANTLPPTDVSGVGEQVLQLAAGLEAAGHEVRVLGRRGEGAANRRGARGPKVLFPVTAVPATLAAARRFHPHVVQVHESDGGLVALAVRLLGRWLGRPRLVALLQVSYGEERRAVRPIGDGETIVGRPGPVERRFRRFKAPLQIALGRLTAHLAQIVLAPSRRTASEIERDYLEGTGRRVRVVPNVTGAELPGREVDPGEGAPGVSETEAPFLFVGRLRLRKGVEVLLSALERLGRDAADATDAGDPGDGADRSGPSLLIAGDGEHRSFLEVRTRELGLDDRVRFLGRADAATVRSLLDRCRALVVPSLYEGMPLVILEAMEAGAPVVASAVSGIPEVVVDGETGWLVPPEDATALAAALAAAHGDPAEARRRGAAGRRRLDERYRPHHAAARWLEVVQEHSGVDYSEADRSEAHRPDPSRQPDVPRRPQDA